MRLAISTKLVYDEIDKVILWDYLINLKIYLKQK